MCQRAFAHTDTLVLLWLTRKEVERETVSFGKNPLPTCRSMLIQQGAAQTAPREQASSRLSVTHPRSAIPHLVPACVWAQDRSRDELRDLRSEVLTCGLQAGLGPWCALRVLKGGTDSVHTQSVRAW